MEAGGPLTVLEIIRIMNCKESDKTEALRLLLQILNSGRQYKEFLCENGAIRAVAECLGNSKQETAQEAARQVTYLAFIVSSLAAADCNFVLPTPLNYINHFTQWQTLVTATHLFHY